MHYDGDEDDELEESRSDDAENTAEHTHMSDDDSPDDSEETDTEAVVDFEDAEDSEASAERKRPGRTSEAEYEYRIGIVRSLLAQKKKKWQIKEYCSDEWGLCSRTVDNYITKARKQMLEEVDTTPEVEFLEASAYLDELMSDDTVPPSVRLAARAEKSSMWGIKKPQKVAVTDSQGRDIQPTATIVFTPEDARARLEQLMKETKPKSE
jgi:hypothetical protein